MIDRTLFPLHVMDSGKYTYDDESWIFRNTPVTIIKRSIRYFNQSYSYRKRVEFKKLVFLSKNTTTIQTYTNKIQKNHLLNDNGNLIN